MLHVKMKQENKKKDRSNNDKKLEQLKEITKQTQSTTKWIRRYGVMKKHRTRKETKRCRKLKKVGDMKLI